MGVMGRGISWAKNCQQIRLGKTVCTQVACCNLVASKGVILFFSYSTGWFRDLMWLPNISLGKLYPCNTNFWPVSEKQTERVFFFKYVDEEHYPKINYLHTFHKNSLRK